MALPAHMAVRVLVTETATAKVHSFMLYYELNVGDDAPTSADIQDYADDFATAYATAMPAVLTTAHTFSGVDVVWTSGTAQIDARSSGAAVAGGISGDVMPEEVAVMIQRRTGLQGRTNRGRVYIPCVPDSFVTGSGLTSGAITAYTGVATMIKNQVTAGPTSSTWLPRTPSFKTNNLREITQARVYTEVVSRRDRRFIKRGSVVAA